MIEHVAARRLYVLSLFWWAILMAAIVVSFRPPIPVTWGDTPSFVESTLRTLEAGKPTVVGGRDPGYPAFLATTFAFGGDLRTAVVVQHAACAALMVALAATVQIVTGTPNALVPVILLAMYPGILMFTNVITAEILYLVFLTLVVLALLLATCVRTAIRCWLVAAAIFLAALATCCKSQGIVVLVAVIPLAIWIAWPDKPRRLAPLILCCLAALALVVTLSRVGASSSDRASVVFVAKTLFCNHLDIALASQAARHEMTAAAGDRADEFVARLATDFASKRDSWPMLGFYGDECFYDAGLDQYLTKTGSDPPGSQSHEIAAIYWRIFLAAILDHPLLYIAKIVRQISYGASVAWPPYGLHSTIPLSADDVAHVREIMSRHGLAPAIVATPAIPVRGWILGDLAWVSAWLFRALSTAFLAAGAFWMVAIATGRHPGFSGPGGIVITLWLASILPSAAAHTLDIWRYLVPSTPMVALLLSLAAAEVAKTVGVNRRGM